MMFVPVFQAEDLKVLLQITLGGRAPNLGGKGSCWRIFASWIFSTLQKLLELKVNSTQEGKLGVLTSHDLTVLTWAELPNGE